MCSNFKQENTGAIQINNNQIEQVKSFNYLGSVVNGNNSIEEEIKQRIVQGNKAYFANLALFRSKLVSRKAKLRLYHTIIRPVVTYAYETWVLKESDKQKLLVFERKILRRIYGPIKEIDGTWRLRRNNELYKIIRNQNIINFIQAQRLRWFGHVHRLPEERFVKRIYKWKPFGTRAQGRPKSRWEDDVVEDLKVMRIRNWNKKTSDRIEWRRIVAQAKTFSK